jgi:hypothetical protein
MSESPLSVPETRRPLAAADCATCDPPLPSSPLKSDGLRISSEKSSAFGQALIDPRQRPGRSAGGGGGAGFVPGDSSGVGGAAAGGTSTFSRLARISPAN